VHSLAIYMKPAEVRCLAPSPTGSASFRTAISNTRGRGSYPAGVAGSARAIVVDGTADRIALDATGKPRTTWHLTWMERDRLTLNQLVFLLESAWLQPRPVEVRQVSWLSRRPGALQLFLNNANLPERILSPPIPRREA
jgi:hypothetical protein